MGLKMNTKVFEISANNLENAFKKMETQTEWDTKGKLFWGYYFLDHDVEKLKKFEKLMEKEGLQEVELRNTKDDNLFVLHLEEHLIHSPSSLFDRCNHFAKLANENNIEIFDGWDVEQENLSNGLIE
jgi:hypothetical protein